MGRAAGLPRRRQQRRRPGGAEGGGGGEGVHRGVGPTGGGPAPWSRRGVLDAQRVELDAGERGRREADGVLAVLRGPAGEQPAGEPRVEGGARHEGRVRQGGGGEDGERGDGGEAGGIRSGGRRLGEEGEERRERRWVLVG